MLIVLFYFAAFIAVVSAMYVVFNRDPVYSAVTLVLCFFSLAVIYLLLEAFFIAVLEIIVYAGAIMVLFLFVLMLLNTGKEVKQPIIKKTTDLIAVFLVLLFVFSIAFVLVIGHTSLHQPLTSNEVGDVSSIGTALFTKYLLPFELASLLLLVALIGTIYLAKRKLS